MNQTTELAAVLTRLREQPDDKLAECVQQITQLRADLDEAEAAIRAEQARRS